jgi:transposase-like protein
MSRTQRKVGSAKSELEQKLPLACADEAAAVRFMEEQRGWTSEAEATCPKCGVFGESYHMKDAKTGERNKRFLWRCRACKSQFTVKVGTVMEDSPIPLTAWCFAFWKACSSKKGVSALQICRQTGLSYKSALFLMHRIRWAMRPANDQIAKVGGEGQTVEVERLSSVVVRVAHIALTARCVAVPRHFSKRKRPSWVLLFVAVWSSFALWRT